jgi:hypothetical protein
VSKFEQNSWLQSSIGIQPTRVDPELAGEIMPLFDAWTHRDANFLATTMDGPSGRRYYVTLEYLPKAGWEWVAWRANAMRLAVQSGVARSPRVAAERAEIALRHLDRSK